MWKASEALRSRALWRRLSLWLGGGVLLLGFMGSGGGQGFSGWPLLAGTLGLGWGMWRSGRRRRMAESKPGCLQRRDHLKLGGHKELHLLQVDGRNLLIGCSAERVELLQSWVASDAGQVEP